jgi:pyruvate dehydrogenase E2 component (dihydrolipoamide acetyltransferase)
MNILMPQLGETVAEGTIIVWYKAVGDVISPGDNLFEIETDKTSMEVPATAAGVLTEIRAPVGSTVPVGSVVAVLASDAGASAAASPVSIAPANKSSNDPFKAVRTPERNYGSATLPSGIKVTPVARRMAAQLNVDLNATAGSGPGGRIVAKDVQTAAQNSSPAPETLAPSTAASTVELAAGQITALFADVPFDEEPLSAMRRISARRLLQAKQTIPHFYLTNDVSTDKLVSTRTDVNALASGTFKLSINDFVIKAMALALQQVPQANAAWAEDRILRFHRSDVAVAVAVDGGLFTPVIRHADSKSLTAISQEMQALAERARTKRLKPAEYQGGAITISNLGMYGVRSFSAIVNPPQAAILAVGAVERRPFEATDGSVRFGSFMTVTLSCDHRVIDGSVGAQLLSSFKRLIETPLALFPL